MRYVWGTCGFLASVADLTCRSRPAHCPTSITGLRAAGLRAIFHRLSWLLDPKTQGKAEPLGELGALMVGLVGVAELEIKEADLVILEERPGMPGAAVDLDRHRARDDECRDVRERRLGLGLVDVLRRRHRHEPG